MKFFCIDLFLSKKGTKSLKKGTILHFISISLYNSKKIYVYLYEC